VLAVAACALSALAVFSVHAAEQNPNACNRQIAGAAVVADFEIQRGPELSLHLPRLGITPELDGMSGPIRVLVFRGEHKSVPVMGPVYENMTPAVYEDVVCLVHPDGNESWYAGVDQEGLTP
jgi:hypothetical protein